MQVIIYCATVQWKAGQLLARLERITKRTEKKVYNLSGTARQRQGSGPERWGKKPVLWRGNGIIHQGCISTGEERIGWSFKIFFVFISHCGLHS